MNSWHLKVAYQSYATHVINIPNAKPSNTSSGVDEGHSISVGDDETGDDEGEGRQEDGCLAANQFQHRTTREPAN